ncbi:PH domain-containing protein [Paractinoplanes atraurantiacus]|uniref:PH domain-containing protein n=1 Tax=Paractinoplanes atraurantiacus TaxID=1036182 RepID=A0A285F2N6_9ACTN|nr:PH domain-containing protein [Actinoplanes atraurantiacus]SNY05557.1 PH domain-containing protein [Actinoplanes atraurantiacus]
MGGPAEPHEPRREGAGRPPEDDDNYGYNDEAFDDVSAYARRGRASDGPGYSPDAGYSPSAGYASDGDPGDEYEPPIITEDELAGLGPEGGGGPRRVLPLEDEPTTLVARYLFPTERYRGEWKRHWISLTGPLGIGAGATLALGYLAGFLTRQNVTGLVTVAVLIWLGVISWVAWKVFDWYFDRFILTNKRVMVVNGIVTRRVAMMPLLRVTDMKYEQSALGRMLSYGTFVLESAGQDQALREVKYLPNPNELYLRVVEEMYEPQAVEARLGKDSEGDDA